MGVVAATIICRRTSASALNSADHRRQVADDQLDAIAQALTGRVRSTARVVRSKSV